MSKPTQIKTYNPNEPDAFKRDGFTLNFSMPNPYIKDAPPIEFSQFAAQYVSDLEYEKRMLERVCKQYERTIADQAELNSRLRKCMADKEAP